MSASSSDNSANNVWVQALTLGPEVYAFRRARAPHGRVLAVLSDAIYIESDEGYVICITAGERVDGPLCMRLSLFDQVRSAPQVIEGAEVTSTLHALTIGGTMRIMWGYAEPWSPPLPSRPGTVEARQAATGLLKSYLTHNRTPDTRPIVEKTDQALYDFRQAIRGEKYDIAANAICSLLGLGEGLTPEGDDSAMALLASVVWWAKIGKLDARNAQLLAQVVRVFANRTTNKISARLLWYAGEGLIYDPAMTLGAALVAGKSEELLEPLQKLLAVGNTTGMAVARGLMTGMRLVTD